jgi:hypothetical protein
MRKSLIKYLMIALVGFSVQASAQVKDRNIEEIKQEAFGPLAYFNHKTFGHKTSCALHCEREP